MAKGKQIIFKHKKDTPHDFYKKETTEKDYFMHR